jgi:hypothetical protein
MEGGFSPEPVINSITASKQPVKPAVLFPALDFSEPPNKGARGENAIDDLDVQLDSGI